MMAALVLNTSRTAKLKLKTRHWEIFLSIQLDSTAEIVSQATSGGHLKECVSSATSTTVLNAKTMVLVLSLVQNA